MFYAYSVIAQAIKGQVKKIHWFDLDKGQLDNPEQFNSIVVPGILIGCSDIEWKPLASQGQQGDGTVTVKLVLRLPAQTHLTDPLLSRNLKELELSDPVEEAVLSVPGVLSLVRSKDYPIGTFYVVEQTYQVQFIKESTLTPVKVQLQINPFLKKPTTP